MSTATAIVTGFRPFLGVEENPSALLVESLDKAWADDLPMQLETRLLDTVYAGMGETIADLLADEPDALVLTGYSSLATGLKIETRATTLCSPKYADASGWSPPPIHDPVTDEMNRVVDFPYLIDTLRQAEVPAQLSEDAGEYVCNHSYWHALDLIVQRRLSTVALFVHLPAIAEMSSPPKGAGVMPLATMQRGLATILRELLSEGETGG